MSRNTADAVHTADTADPAGPSADAPDDTSVPDGVTVAPREIRDLVYRAGRIAGCDPGTAEQIAEDVVFAEIRHGGAVSAFCESLVAGGLARSAWVTAPEALLSGEIAVRSARSAGRASVAFEPAVPLASISATRHRSLERGVAYTGIDHRAHGTAPVQFVELCQASKETRSAGWASAAKLDERAHRVGIDLDRSLFNQLEAAAAPFLVAESVLDQIE